ncbi:MAG TPA: YqiA/YcfP family alpha/beta fold hydrolase [Thermoanaerobaculia bacterium]|jgi:alpha-beta hydrolase superfamily lysophospholipase|nr:YqiA/YcfP family alpha/beta fold hydrolase [Thermoanaerobaculia bacterium]
MTADVLYLHGFASSPASAKITALRPRLQPHGIELDTPDLNVPSFEELDWDAVVALAEEHAERTPPRAMVASSMGSLVALTLVRRGLHLPLVLIAPAFGVAKRWQPRLPVGDTLTVFNYARNSDATIHRRFFDQLIAVDVESEPPPVRTAVLMGRNDQTVAFADVAEVWQRWSARGLAPGSKFIEIPDGDHGLTAEVDRIAAEIVEAVHDRNHS